MVWVYYDESGEYEPGPGGKLLNMSIGGCVASLTKWEAFAPAWDAALKAEGLSYFHMTEFEAWRPPYDFKLPNGERDNEKHKRLLNSLIGLMLGHVECFAAFAAGNLISPDATRAHELAMEDCVLGAVTHAVHDLWDRYQEPINLVFGRQRHFSYAKILKYVDLYDWGEGRGRIKSMSVDDPVNIPQLQAADILAYEMGKEQRAGRARRYPFDTLIRGCIERDLPLTLNCGCIVGTI